MKKSRRRLIFIIIAAFVITLGVIQINKSSNKTEAAFLENYGMNGLSVEEIVYSLDSTKSDPVGLSASITGENLILYDSSEEIKLALPEDKFYLSFAPYITQTHPCATHSLSSCQGELVNQTVNVIITDGKGNEIINSDMTTMENGFVGVWLPRNMNATIQVLYNGLTAQTTFTTFSESNTCLTTLQLS
ncbi:MAG TPA: copper-binding periplasmic metallochaperone CueP [Anaerolineaceae bacterium]|nr:copper-binding periplasmic metallochaperone CueP [Anaerolineaceae bacterium]